MYWRIFNFAGLLALGVWAQGGTAQTVTDPAGQPGVLPHEQQSEEQRSITEGTPALPGSSESESSVGQQDRQSQEEPQAVDQPGQPGQPRLTEEMKGKVIDEKEVKVLGGKARNKLALLELEGGDRIAVDLGPVDAISDRLKAGDTVVVHGRLIQVGEDPVFLASKVEISGQNVDIKRQLSLDDQSSQESTGSQEGSQMGDIERRQYEFTGTIENEQNVDLRTGNMQNKVVLLRTDEGKRVLIDLGPVNKLQGFPITAGTQISVKGHAGLCEDASVLFADQLQAGGQSLKVERPDFE